ncbi:TetR/AcrR family transcriptional regulator [Rhizomonospora bruguierae]|uniref:TetR/AcrR family transcriptional regulator n=1 Tax=Rhizomonospora bruguierae TaxID=1581705 RepID=UPI001BD1AD8C|nr:TetR/AcrR family transcriptional regulator [Micromonospora sp. NBRC 107566]
MERVDRRVRRTRRELHEALIALVLERGYEKITVQDILDRADVGRSTFYAHFRDKESLLLASFDDVRERLWADLDDTARPGPDYPVRALFEHAYRHRMVYQALCGRRGGDVVRRHLHRLLADLLAAHLRPRLAAAGSGVPVEVAAEFCASAAIGLLIWWVDHDFRYGPERLARMYHALAAPGIRAALRADDDHG